MSNNKMVIIAIIVIVAVVVAGGVVVLKNKDNHDDSKNPVQTEKTGDKVYIPEDNIKIGRMIDNLNKINKIFTSNKFDREKFITDDYGEKYYKYTGEDTLDMISLLNAVYLYGLNNGYFKAIQNSETLESELYVYIPENCRSIVELSVPEVDFDKNEYQDGYIDLVIVSKDKTLDFSTTLEKDREGYYKISSLINPCIS